MAIISLRVLSTFTHSFSSFSSKSFSVCLINLQEPVEISHVKEFLCLHITITFSGENALNSIWWNKNITKNRKLYSGEISPTRCNNCVFYSQWLYSICFGWQSHPSSGVQCCIWPHYFSRHSAGNTTQNNKTEITYNSTMKELLYCWQI